jgi:hypothetical protein
VETFNQMDADGQKSPSPFLDSPAPGRLRRNFLPEIRQQCPLGLIV